MPDLPNDLAAMLRDRAEHAPAAPAPSDALVRRVRRRHATRLSLAVVGSAASAGAVAVVAAAAISPTPREVRPAATPTPTLRPADDRYEFCDLGNRAPSIDVAVHRTELKFAEGCYVVAAGAGGLRFTNPQTVPHDLVIVEEGTGTVVHDTAHITAPAGGAETLTARLSFGIEAGDYRLTCSTHPSMHAQLVVR